MENKKVRDGTGEMVRSKGFGESKNHQRIHRFASGREYQTRPSISRGEGTGNGSLDDYDRTLQGARQSDTEDEIHRWYDVEGNLRRT